MMVGYFGRRMAHFDDHVIRYEMPLREPCLRCEEPIVEGDSGVMVLVGKGQLGPLVAVRPEPMHWACWMRGIIGSLSHIEKQCGCFVSGSDHNDPPNVTRREAAELALAAWEQLTMKARRQ